MNIGVNGINLIKSFEQCKLYAYKAVATEQYYTIGWGHYGSDVYAGMTITQSQADTMFEQDIVRYVNAVANARLGFSPNQNQFDALCSFCYNLGTGIMSDFTGLSANQVANEMPLYVKSGGVVLEGLVRRRKEEVALFNTAVSIAVTLIVLSPASITLSRGETYKLLATVNPSNATNQTVTWKTSNSAVAIVSGGVVTAANLGTATITATADGKSATATVIINNVKATSITLNATEIGILKGASSTLTATVNPSDTTDKTIVWSTQSVNTATVVNGIIKGVSMGHTIINAKNPASGLSCNCTVNVRLAPTVIINRFYQKCLGRTPAAWEVDVKVNNLVSGKSTWADIAEEFFLRAEYSSKKTDNETYLNDMYKSLFARSVDSSGLSYYKGLLEYGASRRGILALSISSSEFAGVVATFGCNVGKVSTPEARDQYPRIAFFVNRHYIGALKRNADIDGLNYFTKCLGDKIMNAATFAVSLFEGSEYKNKNTSNEQFIHDAYTTLYFRSEDAGGKTYFMNKLVNGVSRVDVLKLLINSDEYQTNCNNYGVTRGTL